MRFDLVKRYLAASPKKKKKKRERERVVRGGNFPTQLTIILDVCTCD